MLAAKSVLARRMKVKLNQLVAGTLELQAAPRIIGDLDGVAIVHDTDLGFLIMERQAGQGVRLGRADVDGRLGVAHRTPGERGVERAPVGRARLSCVGPVRGVVCLRSEGRNHSEGKENQGGCSCTGPAWHASSFGMLW